MGEAKHIMNGARVLLGIASSRWVLTGPSTLYLEIANLCNTDCIMCPDHTPLLRDGRGDVDGQKNHYHAQKKGYMDPSLLETILREGRDIGVSRIILCGNGEPAIHPNFDSIVDRVIELGMKPYVLTNGIGIDNDRARLWADKRAYFRFSVHAGDVETWLRIHPKGRAEQFEQLSRVIKIIAYSEMPRVSVLHVLQRENYRHVPEMLEYAKQLGVKEVLFQPVRAIEGTEQVVLSPDEERELSTILKSSLKLANSYGIETNVREYLKNNGYVYSGILKTAHIYQEVPCYVGWVHAEFQIDGRMIPCIHSKRVMGRAGEQNIRDMWLSARYREFRRQARSMPRNGRLVDGCRCDECCLTDLNLNIHNLFHLKPAGMTRKIMGFLTMR